MDLSIWTRLFGFIFWDPSIWTRLFGPIYLDPFLWISLFRPVYLDPTIWTPLLVWSGLVWSGDLRIFKGKSNIKTVSSVARIRRLTTRIRRLNNKDQEVKQQGSGGYATRIRRAKKFVFICKFCLTGRSSCDR